MGGKRLHSQARVTFENLLDEPRLFACPPSLSSVPDPVAQCKFVEKLERR